MIRLAILSGKGGTGKTSFTAAFGYLASRNAILCDCDVDAANLSLICEAGAVRSEEYSGGTAAVIDKDSCNSCGRCVHVCRFNSVKIQNGYYLIDENTCEGCGYCSAVCPAQAITLKPVKSGGVFLSQSRFGSYLAFAELNTGAENSGKLSTRVRNVSDETALANKQHLVIIDGPPGISCPAIAAASGTDYVLFTAEPSLSGLSDLKRVMELIKKLKIKSGVIVNRADINKNLTLEIKRIAEEMNVEYLGEIPWSLDFVQAARKLKTVMEVSSDSRVIDVIKLAWEHIIRKMEEKNEDRIQRNG